MAWWEAGFICFAWLLGLGAVLAMCLEGKS